MFILCVIVVESSVPGGNGLLAAFWFFFTGLVSRFILGNIELYNFFSYPIYFDFVFPLSRVLLIVFTYDDIMLVTAVQNPSCSLAVTWQIVQSDIF